MSSSDYSRRNEEPDERFYQEPRLVSHLDAVALRAVEAIIGALVVEPAPEILDLMASWDSHLPASLRPREVIGLGLNETELRMNEAITGRVVYDLNRRPQLPFPEESFDVVLNTVSVDYLVHPRQVFADVARVLRPGGLLLVTFSNRMFPDKAVRIWRTSSEEERVRLVEDHLTACGFTEPSVVVVKGYPRPHADRYAGSGLPSDPVYAVYAARPGPTPHVRPGPTEVARAVQRALPRHPRGRVEPAVGRTGVPHCPHCGQRMRKWAVPQTPFTEWDSEFMYICFNDTCPYLVRGWTVMSSQGNRGISYRQMFIPERRIFTPVPVPSLGALRDGIAD